MLMTKLLPILTFLFLIPVKLVALSNSCYLIFTSTSEKSWPLSEVKMRDFPDDPKTWTVHFMSREWTVQQTPELESRVSFTHSKFQHSNQALASQLLQKYFFGGSDALQMLSNDRYLQADLKANFQTGVSLSPLSSKYEVLHDSYFSNEQSGEPKKTGSIGLISQTEISRPESELPNSPLTIFERGLPASGSSQDRIVIKHWVSWYSETGLYFDTAESALQKMGWAVRLKILSEKDEPMSVTRTLPNATDLQQAKRMTLTIKYSPGGLTGPFTRRIEFHVFLPLDFNVKMAGNLAASVLKSIEPNVFASLPRLAPVSRVDTNRMGLNVVAKQSAEEKPLKIGFVTIDQFNKFKIDFETQSLILQGSGLQTEMEILPEHFGWLQSDKKFGKIVTDLAYDIANQGGQFDHSPKYMTQQLRAPTMRPD